MWAEEREVPLPENNFHGFFIRTGKPTAQVRHGEVVKFLDFTGRSVGSPYCAYDEEGNGVYSCSKDPDLMGFCSEDIRYWTFLNAKTWEEAFSLALSHPVTAQAYFECYLREIEDTTMGSFNEMETKELEIVEGVVQINGTNAEQFSDHKLIKMIGAERKKLATLADELGTESAYYKAKAKVIEGNVAALSKILDARA